MRFRFLSLRPLPDKCLLRGQPGLLHLILNHWSFWYATFFIPFVNILQYSIMYLSSCLLPATLQNVNTPMHKFYVPTFLTSLTRIVSYEQGGLWICVKWMNQGTMNCWENSCIIGSFCKWQRKRGSMWTEWGWWTDFSGSSKWLKFGQTESSCAGQSEGRKNVQNTCAEQAV